MELKKIRVWVAIFISLLVVSGITAFPIFSELNFLLQILPTSVLNSNLGIWLFEVSIALNSVNSSYPFLSYGTDWLGFSHIVIAIFFIGVYIDPVKNIWATKTGIIACLLVFPTAFIAGYYREIPFYWQLIDCCFGALGLVPLIIIHINTTKLITS